MRPLLYDVYSGAGGAAKGYMNAGFRVVGIDNKPQPRYIGDGFIQMDALEFLERLAKGEFEQPDAIHASPPCQLFTRAGQQWRNAGRVYPSLIFDTRNALIATARPYVIENVPGAPLVNPIMLNGAFFGLRVKRTRLFECSFPIEQPLLLMDDTSVKMGRPWDARKGQLFYPVGHFSGVAAARQAMGIDWPMTQGEVAQSIMPAMTEFIGKQLLAAVEATR